MSYRHLRLYGCTERANVVFCKPLQLQQATVLIEVIISLYSLFHVKFSGVSGHHVACAAVQTSGN